MGIGVDPGAIPAESKLVIGAVNSTSEGGQIQLNAPGGTYTTAFFIDNYENTFRVMSGTNTGSTLTRMVVNSAGNVGVGIVNPLSKLHVVAGANTALELEGGIKVGGAAANRAAFQITAGANNLVVVGSGEFAYNVLELNSILSNNNSSCMIFITRVSNEITAPSFNYSVQYDVNTGRWRIRKGVNSNIQNGEIFNVLIVDF